MSNKWKKIIILGGGGHSKVIIGMLQRINNSQIIGFLDDNKEKKEILGVTRIGKLLSSNKIIKNNLVLGLGHVGDTKLRESVVKEYKKKANNFENVIAPSAIISKGVSLGKGIVIMDGAILQPGVSIGDFSIINTKASIDHDCIIGKHVHIAPGVTISGNVIIGNKTLVGTGASIIQGIQIAKNCIVGAGSVVTKNCETEKGVYVGVPAKLIKTK